MTHKAESCSGLLHCKEQPKKKNAEQNDPGKVDGLEGRGPETGAPSHAADRDLKVGGRSGGGSSPCFRTPPLQASSWAKKSKEFGIKKERCARLMGQITCSSSGQIDVLQQEEAHTGAFTGQAPGVGNVAPDLFVTDAFQVTVDFQTPEPLSAIFVAAGLVALGCLRRRSYRRSD